MAQTAAPYVPVKSIDFSSKHDILLRDDDGTLHADGHALLQGRSSLPRGPGKSRGTAIISYLIEGDNEALAIDTGYGAGNIREYLQTLTKKPVQYVANTHDHFDHTANNAYFDRAYMSAEDRREGDRRRSRASPGSTFPKDYPHGYRQRRVQVPAGQPRDRGLRDSRTTRPAAPPISTRKQRILFIGDEIFDGNQPLNVSVAAFAANMRKLEAHRREFDRTAGGPGVFDASNIDKYLAAAEAVLAGKEGELPPAARAPGGQGGPGAAPPAGPNGELVYQRRMVRAPDRNGGQPVVPNPNIRRMTYQDRAISYDMTRIRD